MEDKLFDINKNLHKIHDLNKFPNRLVWKLNNDCNFSCDYCINKFDGAPSKVKVHTPEQFRDLFDKTGKSWLFLITGGEPFLYPRFVQICKALQEKHYLQLSTNMSSESIYEFGNVINPERVFLLSASFHSIERNDNKYRDDFAEKCLYLKNKGFTVLVNYVAHPDTMNRMPGDFEYFASHGLASFAIPMRAVLNGLVYPDAYTEAEIEILKKYLLDVDIDMKTAFGTLDYYGRYCTAGKDYVVIDEYGNLLRCSTLRKKIGNIFDGTFVLNKKMKPCIAKNCSDGHCGVAAVSDRKAFSLCTYLEKRKYDKLLLY